MVVVKLFSGVSLRENQILQTDVVAILRSAFYLNLHLNILEIVYEIENQQLMVSFRKLSKS